MCQEERAEVVRGQCHFKSLCCFSVLGHEHPCIVDEAVQLLVVCKNAVCKLLN